MMDTRKAIAAIGFLFLAACGETASVPDVLAQQDPPTVVDEPKGTVEGNRVTETPEDKKTDEKTPVVDPPVPPAPFCGDGKVDPGEECDDSTCGCEACHIRHVLSVSSGGSVTVPSLGADLPDSALTVEMWTQHTGDTTYASSKESDDDTHLLLRCVDGWANVTFVSPPTQSLPPRAIQVEANVGCGDSDFHHLAVTRTVTQVGPTGLLVRLELFWDGVPVANGELGAYSLGTERPLTFAPVGLLDGVRVSKVARYKTPFVPSKRHVTDSDTLLLLDGSLSDSSSSARLLSTVSSSLVKGTVSCL
jgi:hypothetical protein